jgi:hypothetical protein
MYIIRNIMINREISGTEDKYCRRSARTESEETAGIRGSFVEEGELKDA